MERLKKVGVIAPKKSKDVVSSKIGLGFEKLDRDVFDPEQAYDRVAELGVKWIRIQSGWQRTERVKGKYDFTWLDKVVDNLIARGLKPWICLCYGNDLYGGMATEVFGAVGCAPIFTKEQKSAWLNYVSATVKHFKGRVDHYEIWNEPDGIWCWKTGVNATEYGEFALATGKKIKETDVDIKVIGGSLCLRPLAYINEALSTGMGKYLDYLTFHEYTTDETDVFERVNMLRALVKKYNPNIEIIQGESGSQSRRGGAGALRECAWSPEKQAKQLARHTVADMITGVYFSSYFSCMDMIEALHGKVGDLASYLDYGYFGVIGADFDENGRASGSYTPKPSYYVLQNIASVFAEEFENCELPIVFTPVYTNEYFARQPSRREVVSGCFKRDGGEIFAYWYPSSIMTSSYECTLSMQVYSEYDNVRLLDVMDGSVYEIPDNVVTRDEFGVYKFTNLPIKDTPLILEFGNFAK